MTQNTQVLLMKRLHGEPTDDCFSYVTSQTPTLEDNQVLIKVVWLSLDPYMRGRMNDMKSYVASLEIGDVMTGSRLASWSSLNLRNTRWGTGSQRTWVGKRILSPTPMTHA